MSIRCRSGLLGALVGVAVLLGATAVCETHDSRPNIVFILADDLGYGDVNLEHPELTDRFRHPVIRTPSLARLAAESLVFTDHYAAAPTCSPSRAGLLTGRTPTRLGITLWIDDRGDDGKSFLRGDELTIPELLKTAGYESGVVGKWHLNGADWEDPESWTGWTGSFPLQQGFDQAIVSKENPHVTRELLQNSQRNPGDFFDGHGHPMGVIPGWSSQIVTDYAIEWIRQWVDRKQQFFLYLPYDAVHEKVDNPAEWNAKYQTGEPNEDRYYANVSYLDHQIGRLLDELDTLGIGDETIVFFSSDNGPEVLDVYWGARRSFGTSYPLAGHKRQLFEGGIRVPGLVRWRGRIRPGVSHEPNSTLDALPTLCDLAGVALPGDRDYDGVSLLPHLLHSERVERPRPLYWQVERLEHYETTGEGYERRYDGTRSLKDRPLPIVAVRQGDHVLRGLRTEGGFSAFPQVFEMFDVVADPEESTDLVTHRPELFEKLKDAMSALHRDVERERQRTREWIDGRRAEEQGPRAARASSY